MIKSGEGTIVNIASIAGLCAHAADEPGLPGRAP